MSTTPASMPARIRRLVEELGETDFVLGGTEAWRAMVLEELDYALRPAIHERRIPTFGAIVEPTNDQAKWDAETQLTITHRPIGAMSLAAARRFADGLSSWMMRRLDGRDEVAVFDRPAGSERDLVVLAEAFGATVVQRHPSGTVRLVGTFGVLRWEGHRWHHEPPISEWIDSLQACPEHGDREVLETMIEFAVHDLGSRGIGAILVYQPDEVETPTYEVRLPTPPPLQIMRASDLAHYVMCWLESMARRSLTEPERCGSWEPGWSRAQKPKQMLPDFAECGIPRDAVTASTTAGPRCCAGASCSARRCGRRACRCSPRTSGDKSPSDGASPTNTVNSNTVGRANREAKQTEGRGKRAGRFGVERARVRPRMCPRLRRPTSCRRRRLAASRRSGPWSPARRP